MSTPEQTPQPTSNEVGLDKAPLLAEQQPDARVLLENLGATFEQLPEEEKERLAGLHESLGDIELALEVTGEEDEDLSENRLSALLGFRALSELYEADDFGRLGVDAARMQALIAQEMKEQDGMEGIESFDIDALYEQARTRFDELCAMDPEAVSAKDAEAYGKEMLHVLNAMRSIDALRQDQVRVHSELRTGQGRVLEKLGEHGKAFGLWLGEKFTIENPTNVFTSMVAKLGESGAAEKFGTNVGRFATATVGLTAVAFTIGTSPGASEAATGTAEGGADALRSALIGLGGEVSESATERDMKRMLFDEFSIADEIAVKHGREVGELMINIQFHGGENQENLATLAEKTNALQAYIRDIDAHENRVIQYFPFDGENLFHADGEDSFANKAALDAERFLERKGVSSRSATPEAASVAEQPHTESSKPIRAEITPLGPAEGVRTSLETLGISVPDNTDKADLEMVVYDSRHEIDNQTHEMAHELGRIEREIKGVNERLARDVTFKEQDIQFLVAPDQVRAGQQEVAGMKQRAAGQIEALRTQLGARIEMVEERLRQIDKAEKVLGGFVGDVDIFRQNNEGSVSRSLLEQAQEFLRSGANAQESAKDARQSEGEKERVASVEAVGISLEEQAQNILYLRRQLVTGEQNAALGGSRAAEFKAMADAARPDLHRAEGEFAATQYAERGGFEYAVPGYEGGAPDYDKDNEFKGFVQDAWFTKEAFDDDALPAELRIRLGEKLIAFQDAIAEAAKERIAALEQRQEGAGAAMLSRVEARIKPYHESLLWAVDAEARAEVQKILEGLREGK